MIKKNQKIVGIIPARYGSSRFPGKPLAKILGKSLIERTYENTLRCKLLDSCVVATDDVRIYDHVKDFGGNVVMTSPNNPTGTDRLIEAVGLDLSLKQADIIINVQGDEPCLEPSLIEDVIKALKDEKSAVMSTAIMKIKNEEDAFNTSVVKCVVDLKGYALYFSRALIPLGKNGVFDMQNTYYKHIGIYAYTRDFLLEYGTLQKTPLQTAEDLEQLKVLENGYKIKTVVVDSFSVGVDHPEDIKKVEDLLCNQNTYL